MWGCCWGDSASNSASDSTTASNSASNSRPLLGRSLRTFNAERFAKSEATVTYHADICSQIYHEIVQLDQTNIIVHRELTAKLDFAIAHYKLVSERHRLICSMT